MKITRIWAMPSRWTFKIKPIARLLHNYVNGGIGWVDPFAGENSPAEITNDINPNKPAKHHLHAKTFVDSLTGLYNGVLLDPPYSLTQVKECYEGLGIDLFKDDANMFPQNIKESISPKIKQGGLAISFGWNSQGFGKRLGFKIIEILMVQHGRGHNDTIVVVEQKFRGDLFNSEPTVQEHDATESDSSNAARSKTLNRK